MAWLHSGNPPFLHRIGRRKEQARLTKDAMDLGETSRHMGQGRSNQAIVAAYMLDSKSVAHCNAPAGEHGLL